MVVHLPLQLLNVLLEAFGFDARCTLKLLGQLVELRLHLLLAHLRFVLGVLLDELLLLQLDVSDLLIDIHLFLVEGGLVLDALVEEHPELVGLVDAVDQHGEQGHFLLIGKFSCELMWSDAGKLGRNLGDLFVEGPENVRILALGVQEDQPDYLGPEPLFILDEPVYGRQYLVLLLAGGGNHGGLRRLVVGLPRGLILREQVSQVVLREGGKDVVNHVEALLSDVFELHLLSPVQVLSLA